MCLRAPCCRTVCRIQLRLRVQEQVREQGQVPARAQELSAWVLRASQRALPEQARALRVRELLRERPPQQRRLSPQQRGLLPQLLHLLLPPPLLRPLQPFPLQSQLQEQARVPEQEQEQAREPVPVQGQARVPEQEPVQEPVRVQGLRQVPEQLLPVRQAAWYRS